MSRRAKRILASLVTLATVLPLITCTKEVAHAVMETRDLAAQALPRSEYRLDRLRDSLATNDIRARLGTIDRRLIKISCRVGNQIDCEDGG